MVHSDGVEKEAVSPQEGTATEFAMKRASIEISFGIALGAGIGAALAVVLGAGAAWMGMGIVIGIVIGASMSSKKADSSPPVYNGPVRDDSGFN